MLLTITFATQWLFEFLEGLDVLSPLIPEWVKNIMKTGLWGLWDLISLNVASVSETMPYFALYICFVNKPWK